MKRSELKNLIKEILVEESSQQNQPKLLDTITLDKGTTSERKVKLYDKPTIKNAEKYPNANSNGFEVGDKVRYRSPTDNVYYGTIVGFPNPSNMTPFGLNKWVNAYILVSKGEYSDQAGEHIEIYVNHVNGNIRKVDKLPQQEKQKETKQNKTFLHAPVSSRSSKPSRSFGGHQFADSIGGHSSNYKY
jgi:hypothetical protein